MLFGMVMVLAPADENGSPAPGGAAPAPAGGAPATGSQSAQASQNTSEIAALKAELAALAKEKADRGSADEAAKAAEKERAKKAGELDKVIEAQNGELAALKKQLEDLKGDAGLGKSYRERELKRIDDAKAKLTESQRRILDAQSSVDLKAQLLDEFVARAGGTPTTPNPDAPGGPPAPGGTVDVAKMLLEGTSAGEIESKYPEAYAKYAAGFGTQKKVTSIGGWFKKKSA